MWTLILVSTMTLSVFRLTSRVIFYFQVVRVTTSSRLRVVFQASNRYGNNLQITLADGSIIAIANQFDEDGNVNADTGIGLIKNITVAEDGSETSEGIALDPVFAESADFTQIILTEDAPQFDGGDEYAPLNIVGSAGSDYIDAGLGADFILGNDGHDFIDGSDGDDEIRGGDGNDVLMGGMGADMLYGGTGDDLYIVEFFSGSYGDYDDYGHTEFPMAVDGYYPLYESPEHAMELPKATEHIMSMSSWVSPITCPMLRAPSTTVSTMEICQKTMTSMTATASM